jgi:hypothetical protein
MKELIWVLVAFWNTPATLDNGKCSASNELFQRFSENRPERDGIGRPARRNTAAARGVHCGKPANSARATHTQNQSVPCDIGHNRHK